VLRNHLASDFTYLLLLHHVTNLTN
jgi:hypothetical protein